MQYIFIGLLMLGALYVAYRYGQASAKVLADDKLAAANRSLQEKGKRLTESWHDTLIKFNDAQRTIAQKDSENTSIKIVNKHLSSTIKEMTDSLQKANEEIETLNKVILDKADEITSLEEATEIKNKKIAELEERCLKAETGFEFKSAIID